MKIHFSAAASKNSKYSFNDASEFAVFSGLSPTLLCQRRFDEFSILVKELFSFQSAIFRGAYWRINSYPALDLSQVISE